MSIPATMKFLVRGKSVDFKNREGSSPSIPKSLVDSPTFYPILFFILIGGSNQNSLSFWFTLFFYKWIWAEMAFSYHTSCDGYLRHVQMTIFEFEQGIPIWMIHNQYNYSYWNLLSHLFEDRRNSRTWIKLCNPLLFF